MPAAPLPQLVDVESISDGYFSIDREWRFAYVNARACEVLRRSAAELIGRRYVDLIPDAQGTVFDRAYREAMASGKPGHVEARFEPWGDRWFEARVFPTADGLSVFFHEVTERRRTEQALRDSLQRYRLAASTGELWETEFATGLWRVSDRVKRSLGYEPHEIADDKHGWLALMHPDDREPFIANGTAHLKLRTPYDIEYRVRTKSGDWLWWQARGQAHWDDAGRATYMAGTVVDITARKQAEERARRVGDFYAALSHTNSAIVRMQGSDELFREVCRVCVEYGHARMSFIAMVKGERVEPAAWAGPAEEFLAGIPIPLDTGVPEGHGPIATAIRENRHYVCNDYEADPSTLPWRDRAARIGTQAVAAFPIRRGGRAVGALCLHTTVKGFFDAQLLRLLDELVGDVSFALDNADRDAARIEAERQTLLGFERFAKVFHNAPLAAVIATLDEGRMVDVNDAFCELLQQPRDALVGRTTVELGVWSQAEREAFAQRLRSDRQVRDFALHVELPHLGPRDVLVNADRIEFGGHPCVLTMVNDITERRRAEGAEQARAAAEAASRAKTEFLSRMSHELRTPLNAVLGFSQLLAAPAADALSERQRAQVEMIGQAGWHLLALINDVLDVSRIETGALNVDKRSVDLGPLLDDVLMMSHAQADARGVAFEPAYRLGGSLHAWGDAMRLRQVMLNIVSNAIKYNRSGGKVRLALADDGAFVRIDVEDDGIGMSEQQLAHLFEPFNRLGRERGTVEGTGIGLVLTRQLVQLMQGRIEIDSRLDAGTRVRLWLPSLHAEPPLAHRPPTAPAATDDADTPAGTVLYIEDNEVNLLVIEQLLARWPGVRLVHAQDGLGGIEAARRLRPDLVLLDMRLPDIDGTKVLRTLRADTATAALRVVALSASAMPDEVESARACGADDYWTKPLDFARFLADLKRLLRQPVTR